MKTFHLALATISLGGFCATFAAEPKDHKGFKECNACCESAKKCDSCCHDKGKAEECRACCFSDKKNQ